MTPEEGKLLLDNIKQVIPAMTVVIDHGTFLSVILGLYQDDTKEYDMKIKTIRRKITEIIMAMHGIRF